MSVDVDAAIAAVQREVRLELWRAVEGQHVVVTNRLADSLEEQTLLEDILDRHKPPLPASATKLHWLLFTPFRYPPLARGSRFRSAEDPGVWYGADEQETACAELGYWRWRFLLASPALSELVAQPQTLFTALAKGRSIDLRAKAFDADRDKLEDPDDYQACQAIARACRSAAILLIRYRSLRDTRGRACAAVLHWSAFAEPRPRKQETWLLEVTRERVIWSSANPLKKERFEFPGSLWVKR